MGAAANLTADGFVQLKYHLLEGHLGAMTAWLMNRTTVMAAMLLKNGNGDYIWKQGIQNDASSNILGIPVRMSTTMPAVAANALAVALADWSETYLIVDRMGISVQRDPFTIKPFVEFYTRKRVGGDVVNFDTIKIGVISV
jgi:HK97 family phage major capsid protein